MNKKARINSLIKRAEELLNDLKTFRETLEVEEFFKDFGYKENEFVLYDNQKWIVDRLGFDSAGKVSYVVLYRPEGNSGAQFTSCLVEGWALAEIKNIVKDASDGQIL